MIDSQELFTATTHRPLRCEQIFRGSFIGSERIRSDIPDWIDSLGLSRDATDQAAAFAGSALSRMRNDLFKKIAGKKYHNDDEAGQSFFAIMIAAQIRPPASTPNAIPTLLQYSNSRNGGGMNGSMTQRPD